MTTRTETEATQLEENVAEATANLKKDIDALKEGLADLRKDMSEVVGSVYDLGKHSAGDAREKAQAEIEKRLEQLKEAYETIQKKGSSAAESLHKTLEERPVTSVLIALGFGLLLGKILSAGNNKS